MITGEAIRTRVRAPLIAAAIRAESASPCPGVNQGRTAVPVTSRGSGSVKPLRSTSPLPHSSSKFSRKRSATAGEETVITAFSCLVQESSVQLVEPLHTASESRTAYLWCIRSGTPGMPRAAIGSSARISGLVAGGGWIAGGRSVSVL